MNVYLFIVIAILFGNYILNIIAENLNIKNLKPDLPEEFKGFYDPEKYQKSQKYLIETTRFEILSDTIFTFVTIIFILL